MGKITVFIWKSNVQNQYTTASRAARASEQEESYVGHVAIKLEDNLGSDYISFWPSNGDKSKGLFSTLDTDMQSEGRKAPDVIIEFDSLDPAKIRQHPLYKEYKKQPVIKEISRLTWCGILKLDQPGTSQEQNCCTTAWNLLKASGILNLRPRLAGPENTELRKLYKCDAGSLASGKFDKFSWRKWMVTPATMLHLVASAKEHELNTPKPPLLRKNKTAPILSKL